MELGTNAVFKGLAAYPLASKEPEVDQGASLILMSHLGADGPRLRRP